MENQLHWVLDVTFGEDKSRIRRGDAPENMGVLRRLALNICKKHAPGESTPRKLRKAGWDDAFREKLLFGKNLNALALTSSPHRVDIRQQIRDNNASRLCWTKDINVTAVSMCSNENTYSFFANQIHP